MDIELPGMDGVTALERLRAEPAMAGIVVVAFTASVMPVNRDRFSRAGFAGVIVKPIDVAVFPNQVLVYCTGSARSLMVRPGRLLVVDYMPQNARLLEAMLTPHGYTVTLAHSGGEELEGALRATGPRAPRHPHAGHDRVRRVPPAAR